MYDSLSSTLLKRGYYAPSAYAGGQPQQEQPQQRPGGMPWGKLALTGLLGAGAAYGFGKMKPEGMMGGFANGVDSHVINPIKNLFSPATSGNPEMHGQQMLGDANRAGFLGQFKDIHHDSQLQGTRFYQPGKLEGAANVGAGAAGVGATIGGVASMGRKILPRALTRPIFHSTGGAGVVAGRGVGMLAKAAPWLGAAMTVPDSMQLGSKINDHLGIKNRLGRAAVTTGTVGAGVGSAMGGAALGTAILPGFGTVIGGTLGALAPRLINGVMNRINRNKMLINGASARAGQLKTDFQRALQANQTGNRSLLQGWYGTQTPAQLNMTIQQFQNDPQLQRQIQHYNPNRTL